MEYRPLQLAALAAPVTARARQVVLQLQPLLVLEVFQHNKAVLRQQLRCRPYLHLQPLLRQLLRLQLYLLQRRRTR